MSSLKVPEEYRSMLYDKPWDAIVTCGLSEFEEYDGQRMSHHFFVNLMPDWANYIITDTGAFATYVEKLPPLYIHSRLGETFQWMNKGGKTVRWVECGFIGPAEFALKILCIRGAHVPREWWTHHNFKGTQCIRF